MRQPPRHYSALSATSRPTASSYAARRLRLHLFILGQLGRHVARAFSPASRVSISELLGAADQATTMPALADGRLMVLGVHCPSCLFPDLAFQPIYKIIEVRHILISLWQYTRPCRWREERANLLL